MDATLEYIQKHFAWLIAAIIAGLLAWLGLWINKQRITKVFTWERITDVVMISPRLRKSRKVFVTYEGKPVDDIRFIELEFANAGFPTITETDFYKPVEVEFTHEIEVLDAEITMSSPQRFEPEIEVQRDRVHFVPTLMNGGDKFRIAIITSAPQGGSMQIKGRINGVKDITLARSKNSLWQKRTTLFSVGTISATALLFLMMTIWNRIPQHSLTSRIAAWAIAIFLMVTWALISISFYNLILLPDLKRRALKRSQ